MKCTELIKLLEELAPPAAAASWDNSGIQVIGGREEVKRMAVALDPSINTIDRAMEHGADFVLCHHPLLLKPAFLNKDNAYSRIVRRLMQADAWLYSAHTSLDAQPTGPVRWLAEDLDLKEVCLLEYEADDAVYGFGFCGNLPEKIPFERFVCLLAAKTAVKGVNICGPRPDGVKRVACCPGAGSNLWSAAKTLGADVLITGDLKYHTALEAEICVLDVGHFSLEEEMMRRLAVHLQQHLVGVEVIFLEACDPIQPYIV